MGFSCDCKAGYLLVLPESEEYQAACSSYHTSSLSDDGLTCVPICDQGWGDHGCCMSANKCHCVLGFIGDKCETECDCNGNSYCTENRLDNCTECLRNTTGSKCEYCDYGFVGDPTTNSTCKPCMELCNNNSRECYDSSLFAVHRSTRGTKAENAQCINCADHSSGRTCDICSSRFYKDNGRCVPCNCNGHSNDNMCDDHGTFCTCQHNTSSSKQSDPHSQCDTCDKNFAGQPRNNHQCYLIVNMKSTVCLDALKPKSERCSPMIKGSASYFTLNPHRGLLSDSYNDDITLFITLDEGELEIYITTSPMIIQSQINSENHNITIDYLSSYDDTTYPIKSRLRNTRSANQIADYTASPSTGNDGLNYEEITARDEEVFYYNFKHRNPPLVKISNIQPRAVIIFSAQKYDFRRQRFYIITKSMATSTKGILYFTSIKSQLDLMVFFSVFLSSVILVCNFIIILLKFRQIWLLRQMRENREQELLTMAERPFSCKMVCMTQPTNISDDYEELSSLIGPSHSHDDVPFNVVPVALEPLPENPSPTSVVVGTVFMLLPGDEGRPVKAALASTLLTWRLGTMSKRGTSSGVQDTSV